MRVSSASNGFSGLASGLDTQSMVDKLLSGTQGKIDKQNQLKQQSVWKQQMYRQVTSSFKTFQSSFFSFTNPTTNLLSTAFYNGVKSTSSSSAVKVTGTSSASTGNLKITDIQLATKASQVSGTPVTGALTGTIDPTLLDKTVKLDIGGKEVNLSIVGSTNADVLTNIQTQLTNQGVTDVTATINGSKLSLKHTNDKEPIEVKSGSPLGLKVFGMEAGKKFQGEMISTVDLSKNKLDYTIDLDGVAKKFTIDGNTPVADLGNAFKSEMQKAFGNTAVSINVTGNKLDITVNGGRKLTITGDDISMDVIGMKTGQSNKMNPNMKLKDINFSSTLVGTQPDNTFEFELNGVKIKATGEDTLKSVMDKINTSKAGVKITYSALSDGFKLEATTSGAGVQLTTSDSSGNLLSTLFGGATATAGQDAKLTINGKPIERSSNSFDFEGMKIELTAETPPGEVVEIVTTSDTTSMVSGLKSFVGEYNKLVDSINKLLQEDPTFKEYPPLTSEQKKDMSESEIKLWEEKAKEGLIRRDSIISSVMEEMRSILYQKPAGAKYSLFDLGITTGQWKEGGKLVMEDPPEKLIKAMEENPGEIQKLFADPKEGLAYRFNEVLKNATTKNNSGKSLVNLAGLDGAPDNDSSLKKQQNTIDANLKKLTRTYQLEKSRYWKQWNAMEKVISSLNQQSSWLAQQMG